MFGKLTFKLRPKPKPQADRSATLRPMPVRPSPMVGELNGKRDGG